MVIIRWYKLDQVVKDKLTYTLQGPLKTPRTNTLNPLFIRINIAFESVAILLIMEIRFYIRDDFF